MESIREIKFRAWDEEDKVMHYFQLHDIRHEGSLIIYGDSDCIGDYSYFAPIEDGPVMQYTGLKDKKGQEIYEGDIVRQAADDEVIVFKIKYSDNDAAFLRVIAGGASQEWTEDYITSIDAERCEVIGNIYQNPKLLGKQ